MNNNNTQFDLSACRGGSVGALLYTGGTFACHALFSPETSSDGQYVMVLFFTVPVGTVIEFVSSKILSLKLKFPQEAKELLSKAMQWSVLAIGFCIFLVVLNSHLSPDEIRRGIGFFLPLTGLPLLWFVVLKRIAFGRGQK